MSRPIKEQIRVLVKEHERGLLPTADYRRLRRALLQRAARGEMNAPPEPTVTRPRPPKTVADVTPDVAEAKPKTPEAQDMPRSDPTNRRPPKPVATDATPKSRKSPWPWLLGGLVLVIGGGGALIGLQPRTPTDVVDPVAAQAPTDDPARQLVQGYLDIGDWSPGRIRELGANWNDLPSSAVQDVKSTGWYRELAREVRDRLRLSRSSDLRGTSATTTELLQLAQNIGLRVDQRPEIATAETPRPAPKTARPVAIEPAPRVTQPERAQVDPKTATPPEIANTQTAPEPEPEVESPSAETPPVPSQPVVTTAGPEKKVEPEPELEKTAAAAAAGVPGQCEERYGKARSRFCRDPQPDGSPGPRLAIVRPGSFEMGSTSAPQEQPVRRVSVARPFAIAVHETSFAQYNAYCAANDCPPAQNPWGDDSLPVVNVTWRDARDFAVWWSAQTGHRYRLPTEAEWEFAARGGLATDYPFGDEVSALNAHFSGGKKMDRPLPAEGRLIVGNKLGLKHIVGNAREWVHDVWSPDYVDAPSDGRARLVGDEQRRVVRGGSYLDRAAALRSSARDFQDAGSRDPQTGFRLVREIQTN